jgi:cyclophilin family peptidyl-prolyl cis-trans isomerase
MVCLIEQGPNFFIALGAHPEWGHQHSVFGDVADSADMTRVESLLQLPAHGEKWGQVKVVVLNESAPISFHMAD